MSGGGEPGAATVDIGIARAAALPEAAQRVLETSSSAHSPEQATRFALGRQARDAVESSPKPLKTLTTLAERFGKKTPEIPPRDIAEAKDRSVVADNIGPLDRELARASTIETAGAVARHIIENGSLNGIDPSILGDLRSTMAELIPEIADVPITDAHMLDLFANANITDPEVMQVIIRKYKEIQAREVPEDIVTAREAKAKADRALEEAEARQRKLKDEHARLSERQESLDPENEDPDSDNQRLIRLRATRPEDRLTRAQGDVKRAEARLVEAKKKFESNPTDPQAKAEMDAAEAEADRLIGVREGIQRDIDTITSLTEERGRVGRAIPKNAEQLEAAEQALQTAKDRAAAIDTAYTTIKGDRIDFETDYANDYKNLVRDAIIEVNDRRAAEINERLVADAEKSGNETERFIAARLAKRYTRTIPPGALVNERSGRFGFFRRVKTAEVVPDVEKARRDVETHLLTDGGYGPIGLLKLELMKAYNGDEAKVDGMMADPAFVKKWSVEIAITALNAYQQNGGKLNEGQARFIASKGLIGPEILSALMSKSEVKATEAEMKQKGELPPEGFNGALTTEEGKKKYLALIFKIASGTMGPAAAAVVGAAAQTAHGGGH